MASRRGLIGGFALGTTLGLVWTPCAGPVLGSNPDRGRDVEGPAWASLSLVVSPLVRRSRCWTIAYGGQAVTTRIRGFARIAPRLQRGFGIVVIAFAALSYFQYDTLIVAWLTGFYPNGQIGL